MIQDNLTAKQNDYAVFLPAISGFYATYVGKQRDPVNGPYVDPARLPAGIQDMEMMNWLNSKQGLFPYKWSLYSGGHANLDLNKQDWSEDMVRNREPGTMMLGDSGGFQIAKGLWEGDWKANSGCPKAQKKRESILKWLDGVSDYGMTLDIPTWVIHDKKASKACGISTLKEAVDATKFNNDYFMANRKGTKNGGMKVLNVLQGASHSDAEQWYQTMKHYCDPTLYPDTHFNGWSMGGQNMCDVHLVLKRLVALRHDNLLQQGVHDWMHFLGTSKLEWAVLLTVIQRAVRKYVNPDFTISFDCASPFLATANGQVYHEIVLPHNGKWSYRMNPIVDDKKYANDTRPYGQAVVADGFVDHFDESPISAQLQMKDICIYKAGVLKAGVADTPENRLLPDNYDVLPDVNKIGKFGKTSWDSFSYALLMGHNVWLHLESVQRANREFDKGNRPRMMWDTNGSHEKFEDIVEAIFATSDRAEAEAIIEQYDRYWMDIVGTRGFKGKKAKNSRTLFNNLFEAVDDQAEDSVQLEQALDTLIAIQEDLG
jgi:hypothetical protein|tara:strand:+ start:24058 stop:25683 length:1626 start_codon:yes stop_codon:yes gene_type:complete